MSGLQRSLKRLRERIILKIDRDIYRKLVQHGDEKRAILMAERCYKRCVEDGKRKPSEMWPACRVQRLVKEIRNKINDTEEAKCP